MDLDRLADNRTPMAVRCVPLEDRHGRDVLVVIAKMTYAVAPDGAARPLVEGAPVRMYDVPTSGARWSSIRYPGELVDEKSGTDVVLVGTAYPPVDRAVTEMDVRLRVETGARTLEKTVRVFGPRVWASGTLAVAPGPAARLAPTPLLYELAYGGVEEGPGGSLHMERRNPAGTGFVADGARERLAGLAAPVIEDPRRPLHSSQPAPAGFGAIPAHWSPRSEWAGTFDAAWQRERAPMRPLDFDLRHHGCADPELWSPAPLRGDEAVEVVGATPEGSWRFRLPRYTPAVEAVVRGVVLRQTPELDTYVIDADAGRVEVTYRTRFPMPRKPELLEVVRLRGAFEEAGA